MGALPSQKYEEILLAFVEYYNKNHILFIDEQEVSEFLNKCDNKEIDVY